MAIRSIEMEIPEKKVVKKQTSTYPKEWLDTKLDILLGIIASKLPVIGITIVEKLLNTPQFKEILRERLVEYYQSAHAYAFEGLKRVVRTTMSKDSFDFSFDTFKDIVVDLEKEFCSNLPELGVEDEQTLTAFVKNQVNYYTKSWNWSYTA